MKNFLRNAWEDSVWSKVIAAIIVALGGVLVSTIKSFCSNVSFGTAILNKPLVLVGPRGIRKFWVNGYEGRRLAVSALFL